MAKTSKYVRDIYGDPPENIDRQLNDIVLDDDQHAYANAIWDPDTLVIMANARSGSGKTTIACAVANMLVKYQMYDGKYDGILYIASPTQEQKQGYLPGSLQEKSTPYFEPMIEAMIACDMNPEVELKKPDDNKNEKNGTAIVECITHTFLRGTNLEHKIIIIDEAQNYYTDELQKVLTRIHDTSKAIVIGHTGQIDLYKNRENSGFDKYIAHYQRAVDAGDKRVKICNLTHNYRGWISNYADSINNEEWTQELLASIDHNEE